MGTENQHLPQPPLPGPAAPGPQLVAGTPHGSRGPGNRPSRVRMSWSRRLEKIILTIFCLQVGIVLLVFPWTSVWDNNYFFGIADNLRPVLLSPYFRGAVNGLGILNLYLAVTEFIEFVGSFLEEPTRRV